MDDQEQVEKRTVTCDKCGCEIAIGDDLLFTHPSASEDECKYGSGGDLCEDCYVDEENAYERLLKRNRIEDFLKSLDFEERGLLAEVTTQLGTEGIPIYPDLVVMMEKALEKMSKESA